MFKVLHMYICTRRGEERADVKGGVMCLNRTNRPSVCTYQGCVGSELEVMCLIHQVLHTYVRTHASMSQGVCCRCVGSVLEVCRECAVGV